KNVVTCATVGGTYQGDGAVCGATPCPPTGACCAGSGVCATRTQAACGNQLGVYRGDGTCCGTANCTPGFDTGPFDQLTNGGTAIYTGFSSGATGATTPQRWAAQAFTLPSAATITQINTDGFVVDVPNGQASNNDFTTLRYVIWNRTANASFPVGVAPATLT